MNCIYTFHWKSLLSSQIILIWSKFSAISPLAENDRLRRYFLNFSHGKEKRARKTGIVYHGPASPQIHEACAEKLTHQWAFNSSCVSLLGLPTIPRPRVQRFNYPTRWSFVQAPVKRSTWKSLGLHAARVCRSVCAKLCQGHLQTEALHGISLRRQGMDQASLKSLATAAKAIQIYRYWNHFHATSHDSPAPWQACVAV